MLPAYKIRLNDEIMRNVHNRKFYHQVHDNLLDTDFDTAYIS